MPKQRDVAKTRSLPGSIDTYESFVGAQSHLYDIGFELFFKKRAQKHGISKRWKQRSCSSNYYYLNGTIVMEVEKPTKKVFLRTEDIKFFLRSFPILAVNVRIVVIYYEKHSKILRFTSETSDHAPKDALPWTLLQISSSPKERRSCTSWDIQLCSL